MAAFHILLPLTAPLVDVFFLYGLVFADPALTLLLGAGMLGVQLLTALYAFRLEREPLDVLWVFPAQQVVYRQLMYSVLIRSVASAVSGVAVRWQRMNRIGVLNNLLPKQPSVALARPRSTTTPRRWRWSAATSCSDGARAGRRRTPPPSRR